MTADLLPHLAAVDLAAAVAVILAIALRRPLRRWVGPRLAYWVWLVVPAAMLASLAPRPAVVLHTVAAPMRQTAVAQDTIEWVMVSTGQAAHAAKSFDPAVLLYVWLAGAAGFAIFLMVGQHRALARFGLLGRDGAGFTRAASREAGPALIGLVRPRIILPTDFEQRFGPLEQTLILAHERTHLRHGDLWINGLAAVIQILNWFNPLVHLAAFLLRVDQELACDAAVVKRFPGERRTYAEALLKSQQACIPMPLGCHWPGRSPQLLQERLTMLAHHQPNRARLMAGGALIGALCLAAGAAAWAASPVRTTQPAAPAVLAYASAAPTPIQAAASGRAVGSAAAPGPARPSLSGDYAPGEAVLTSPSIIGVSCFSNSCSAPSATGPRDSAAVAAAIRSGDAKAVVAAGGSADDVLAAWRSADALSGRAEVPGRPNDRIVPGTAEIISTQNGMVAVRAQADGGGTIIMSRGDPLSPANASQLILDARAGAGETAGQVLRNVTLSADGRQNVLFVNSANGDAGGPTIVPPPGGYGTVTIQDVRAAPAGGAAYLNVRPSPVQAGQ